jgi:hypothetical protein
MFITLINSTCNRLCKLSSLKYLAKPPLVSYCKWLKDLENYQGLTDTLLTKFQVGNLKTTKQICLGFLLVLFYWTFTIVYFFS